MGYQLGVDLGTTFAAAATWSDGRATIAPLGTSSATIPSVVFIADDLSILTGDAAARRAAGHPERIVREFKRRIGDPTPIVVADTSFAAEQLTAALLEAVVDQVGREQGENHELLIVTHPANWGNYKLDRLQDAIRQAGVDMARLELLAEPEAAAISYSSSDRIEPGTIFAVYDLGGGTFDATVLRRTDTKFEILGKPEGVEHLGGVDFDATVLAHVMAATPKAFDDLDADDPPTMAAMLRLRDDCVAAKEALSADTDTAISVLLPGHHGEVRLTRAELEAMIRPTLSDSIDAMGRALRSAGIEATDLDRILLVGGSSRIPLVSQLVSSAFGRPVATDTHPKHVVALGAARFAGLAEAAPSTAGRPVNASAGPTMAAPAAAVAATQAAKAVLDQPSQPTQAPPAVLDQPSQPTQAAPAVVPAVGSGVSGASEPPHVDPVTASTALDTPPRPSTATAEAGAGAATGAILPPPDTVPLQSTSSEPPFTQGERVHRWDQASSGRGSTLRRGALAAVVGGLVLLGGAGAYALTQRDGTTSGRASSSAEEARAEIVEELAATAAETDPLAEDRLDSSGTIESTNNSTRSSLDDDDSSGSAATAANTSPSATGTSSTPAATTTSTTTASTTTTSTTVETTTTTETTVAGSAPIQITVAPFLTFVDSSSFRFEYVTNQVCGDGQFTVVKKSSKEFIGAFPGGGGVCSGPVHGGFPQASGFFGSYALEPGTTYTVAITVRGTVSGAGDSLPTGTGSDTATIEVTTSG